MATWKDILGLGQMTKDYAKPAPVGMKYATGRHGGADIVLKNDNVPSFTSGTVYKTGYDPDGWGNYAVVKNNDGFYTIYAHMNKTAVKTGDKVKEGSLIGVQGQTGQATGKHLHLEVRSDYTNNKSTIAPNVYFAANPNSWETKTNQKLSQAEMAGRVPWATPEEKAVTGYSTFGFLKDISLGFLVKAGFVLAGIFFIYIAITKGMFGGSGE